MYINVQRFLSSAGSLLDGLLEKQDVTLEEFLNEDILPEIRANGSQKFANLQAKKPYFSVIKNVNNYKSMINYILSLDQENAKLIRYQFMISEILSYNNPILIDYLFEPERNIPKYEEQEAERKQLLPKFFQPFQADFLNITQAGYLSKIVQSIVQKRGNSLWGFLMKNESIISNLIKHLDVSHTSEILLKLINYPPNDENYDSDHLNERRALLQRIITLMMNKIHQQDIVNSCCHILIELCEKSSQFFDILNQPHPFYLAACNSGNIQLLNVVIMLIEAIFKSLDSGKAYDYSQFNKIANSIHLQFQSNKIDFAFETSLGTVQIPLSQFRLRLLGIYYLLLQTNNNQLISLINHKKIFQTLYNYIIKFEFNNQLQNLFYNITIFIYKTPTLEQARLEIQDELFHFIETHNTQIKFNFGTLKKPISRGYFGILSKLSYQLEKIAENAEKWQSYKENVLNNLKKIESHYFFDINPKSQKTEQEVQLTVESINDIQKKLEEHRRQNLLLKQQDEELQNNIGVQQNGCNAGDDPPTPIVQRADEKKIIQETLQIVVTCSETSPGDIQDILAIQELQNTFCSSPQSIETQLDKTVNKYWQTHQMDESLLYQNETPKKGQDLQKQILDEIKEEPSEWQEENQICNVNTSPVQEKM